MTTFRLLMAYGCLWIARGLNRWAIQLLPNTSLVKQPVSQVMSLSVPYHPSELEQKAATVAAHYDVTLMLVGTQVCAVPRQIAGSC